MRAIKLEDTMTEKEDSVAFQRVTHHACAEESQASMDFERVLSGAGKSFSEMPQGNNVSAGLNLRKTKCKLRPLRVNIIGARAFQT
jgi:hypothetical protein